MMAEENTRETLSPSDDISISSIVSDQSFNHAQASRKRRLAEETQLIPADQKARAKRMMGHLMGTLTKIKDDMGNRPEADRKREDVQRKTLEKIQKDREEAERSANDAKQRRETELAERRKRDNDELLSGLNACWSEQKANLSHFKLTVTEPRLYYLPKIIDADTESSTDTMQVDTHSSAADRTSEGAAIYIAMDTADVSCTRPDHAATGASSIDDLTAPRSEDHSA